MAMASKPIKVLLVEDSSGEARLVREMLAEADRAEYSLTHVQRLSEALERLSEETYDVTLLDLGLPDSHGLDTVAQARAHAPTVPIVVLTGFQDEALALKAVPEGAQDYLVKGQVDSDALTRSLRYATERKRVEEALRRSEIEAAKAAYLQESRRRIVAAQEGVRKEIAQELHGPVQTRLLMLEQRLHSLSDHLNTSQGDAEEKLAELAMELKGVRENQIRRVSHQLHPSIILVGLRASLRSLRDHLERAVPIKLENDPEVAEMEGPGVSPIPEEARLSLYRVAEEAMANVLKHSQASQAVIRLGIGVEKETLVLSVEDNGQGFDPEAAARGLGLTTIDDYLGAMGGSYTLEAAPGSGTKIIATIPLNHSAHDAPEDLAGQSVA